MIFWSYQWKRKVYFFHDQLTLKTVHLIPSRFISLEMEKIENDFNILTPVTRSPSAVIYSSRVEFSRSIIFSAHCFAINQPIASCIALYVCTYRRSNAPDSARHLKDVHFTFVLRLNIGTSWFVTKISLRYLLKDIFKMSEKWFLIDV